MANDSTYKKCQCGSNCKYFDKRYYEKGEDGFLPCWGEVGPLGLSDEDDFGHFCEGHCELYWGGVYTPKPPNETNKNKLV